MRKCGILGFRIRKNIFDILTFVFSVFIVMDFVFLTSAVIDFVFLVFNILILVFWACTKQRL